jgi:hypothetical protein
MGSDCGGSHIPSLETPPVNSVVCHDIANYQIYMSVF